MRSYVSHINILLSVVREEKSGSGTESAWLRKDCPPFILITLTHKKIEKKNKEEKGITDPRNSFAISIHPIGCRMSARRVSEIQRCKKEGQRVWQRSLLSTNGPRQRCGISILFLFPTAFPVEFAKRFRILKERFHPFSLISLLISISDGTETRVRNWTKVSSNRERSSLRCIFIWV